MAAPFSKLLDGAVRFLPSNQTFCSIFANFNATPLIGQIIHDPFSPDILLFSIQIVGASSAQSSGVIDIMGHFGCI